MAADTLKQKTKKGLYWSAAGNIANQGISFLLSIVLARLLCPEDYGAIGMLTVFILVFSVFIDCGFSQALIHKQNRTQTDFSTEFFFNVVVGACVYIILFIASPYIADFYNLPILSPLLKVTAIGVILNSLCVVQSAQFAIKLDFQTPALINIVSNFVSGILGIYLAYKGFGVWALAFQQIVSRVINASLLWIYSRWMPTMDFSWESFRYLWRFGSKILGTSLISQIYDNIHPLVIGRFFNATNLGLYSRGQHFAQLPSSNIGSILSNVTFPVLCKLQNDEERLRRVYCDMMNLTAYIVFPLMVLLASLAKPIIHILLNEQWYDCVILLQLLCFALLWNPLCAVNLNLMKATNNVKIMFKLEIVKKWFIGLLVIFISIQYGIVGLCIGHVFYVFSCFVINTYFTARILHESFFCQTKNIALIFVNSIIMGGCIWLIINKIPNNYYSMFVGIIMGGIYYFVTSKFFFEKQWVNLKKLLFS